MTHQVIKPLYLDPTHLLPREADASDIVAGSYGDIVKEPSGFPNRVDSTLSFDDSTRTFSISPVSSSFDVYIGGFKNTFTTAQTIQLSAATGIYWIYFSRDTNQLSVANTTNPSTIILNHTPVAIIYWQQTQLKAIYFGDERHGIVMDSATHAHLHQTMGAVYRSGLSLAGMIVDANGSLDSHASFDCDSGRIADEDIEHLIPASTQFPLMYRLNAGEWYSTSSQNVPLIIQSGTRPSYNTFNTSWQLVECPNTEFLLIHVVATNCKLNPVICILGNTYKTKSTAKAGAQTEFLSLAGLPFSEFVPVATVIYQCADSYTNSTNSRIVSFDGSDYVDWRTVSSFSVANSQSIESVPDTNPVFTYSGEMVSRIDYSSGNYKVLSYSGEVLDYIDYHKNGSIIRKTFVYDAFGKVTSINETII